MWRKSEECICITKCKLSLLVGALSLISKVLSLSVKLKMSAQISSEVNDYLFPVYAWMSKKIPENYTKCNNKAKRKNKGKKMNDRVILVIERCSFLLGKQVMKMRKIKWNFKKIKIKSITNTMLRKKVINSFFSFCSICTKFSSFHCFSYFSV